MVARVTILAPAAIGVCMSYEGGLVSRGVAWLTGGSPDAKIIRLPTETFCRQVNPTEGGQTSVGYAILRA